MKNIALLSLLALAGINLGGCKLSQMIKLAKEQKIKANPNPLEVHKDTVNFDLSGNLPTKMLKKGTTYTLNTYYKYSDGGKEYAFEPVSFKAEDYPANKTEPTSVTKNFSFPYKDEYQSGTVEIEGVAIKGGKSKKTPRLPIAVGIISTSKLVVPSYYAAFAPHGYNTEEELETVAIPNFIFERGKSVLTKSEMRSPKFNKLDKFIASKNVTRTVTIVSSHSPEGAERINSSLAQERAAVIEKLYRTEMDKYDYEDIAKDIKFVLRPIVDDWNLLLAALDETTILTEAQKNEYRAIIKGGSGSFAEKESQLQKLSTYKKVFDQIYPTLRKASTEILTVKAKKTADQISMLSKQIIAGQQKLDTLSFEELMYSATLTPLLDEKAAIYEAASRKEANWLTHNNLGATYLQEAIAMPSKRAEFMEKAKSELEIAAKLNGAAPEVNANMATISLMQGNPYKAAQYANRSISGGATGDVRMGVLGVKSSADICKADYGSAINATSAALSTAENSFNKGLANLLTKNYSAATSAFTEAIKMKSDNALAYYALSIVSARTGVAEGVTTNLKEAVRIDPTFKQKALSDLEFAKFSATEAFRNVLK